MLINCQKRKCTAIGGGGRGGGREGGGGGRGGEGGGEGGGGRGAGKKEVEVTEGVK